MTTPTPSGNHLLARSVLACAVPALVIATLSTIGASLGWGDLNFANPSYYLILLVAAWCPVSKLAVWRLWRREVETCWMCKPANSIGRRLSPIPSARGSPVLGEPILHE